MRTRRNPEVYTWNSGPIMVSSKHRPRGVLKSSARLTRWPRGRRALRHNNPTGLINTGDYTCYRRAIDQCLLHLPAMHSHLGRVHHPCARQVDECVVCAMQNMNDRYWNELSRTTAPHVSELDCAIQYTGQDAAVDRRMYRDLRTVGRQGEPMDYFNFVYDNLKHAEVLHSDLLDKLFSHRLDYAWTCDNCNKVTANDSSNTPKGIFIRLELAGHADDTFEQLLDRHFVSEEMKTCQNVCPQLGPNPPRNRIMQKTIGQAPEVLLIHIDRVSEDITGRRFKEYAHVQYPIDLDLSRFRANGSALNYRLYGVVAHEGGAGGGHYIAGVRTKEGADKRFALLSDASKPAYDEEDRPLTRPRRRGTKGADPTCLFYVRV